MFWPGQARSREQLPGDGDASTPCGFCFVGADVCVCVCCFHLPLFDFHFSYAVLRLNDGLPLGRSSGLELECHRRGLAQRQRVESSLGPNEASSRGHWAPDLQIKNMPLLRLFKLTLFS